MSANKLRKIAISLFKKGEFEQAIMFFSLAYNKKKEQEFLLFIELCKLAKDDKDGILALFDLYCDDIKENQKENLEQIIQIVENTQIRKNFHINSVNGICYSDFLDIATKTGDFKKTFENTICSTKIVLSSQEELTSLIDNLIANGLQDLAMNYLEDFSLSFDYLSARLKTKIQ